MKQFVTKTAIYFFSFFLCATISQAQQFKWVQGGGSTEDMTSLADIYQEQTNYMCTDANGNVYALNQVGYFDVSADTFYMGLAHSSSNVLITSYTCNGQMRWAKLISSSGGEAFASGIAIDASGHLYVSGLFQPGSGILYIGYDTTISGASIEDLTTALIQFDTSGNFNWIRFVGDNTSVSLYGFDYGSALTLDGTGNAHFLNYMRSGMHLMPGDTSQHGVYDMAYNPTGTLLSAVRLDMDSQWYLNDAVIDPVTNKLYVCGQINVGIYGGSLTDTFYAAAFDASRSLLWQYFVGNDSQGAVINAVTLDQNKNLHFCGYDGSGIVGIPASFSFNGMSVSNTHYAAGTMSVVFTTDTNGYPKWMKHFDGDGGYNYLNALTQLANGKIAAAGFFTETVTDGTFSVSVFPLGGGTNPFLVIVDSAGDVQAMQQMYGDAYLNGASAITSDQAGNLYTGGFVEDSITAGTPPIPAYHSVGGNTDFFVMKYGVDCSCTSGPVASYTDTGTHIIEVTYTGTTTGLDSVVWRFADGGTATGVTAYHTYTLAGTYRVCGTVYTTCGSDIYCTDVTILCGLPPVASFTKTGTNVLATTYTGTTSTVDSVGWIFGDGTIDTGITATHTYTATGTYDVCAIAYSMCGNDTACHYDTVVCVAPPVASFTSTGTSTIDVTYTGTTTGVDSIGWIFGDGYRTDGTTATHAYTTPGTYSVCVVAHSSCGNDTACQYDTILCITAPIATFTDTGVITIGTTYTGTTTAIDSIVWNFGDGSSDTGMTGIHTYTAVGIYHICVTAYNPCGSSIYCLYDTVLCIAAPTASFSDTGTHTVGFAYTGSTADIDSVVWSYGDGNTATGLTPIHTYTASGSYNVCVTVYTGCGMDSSCSNVSVIVPRTWVSVTSLQTINVFPNPANDELNITGVIELTNYRLLTITGTCVGQGVLQPGSNSVSMQSVVPGVYVLELVGENGERDMVRVVKE